MYESLSETLKHLTESIKSVTDDHLINLFDDKKCLEIDERSNDPLQKFVLARRNRCIANLNKCKIDHTDHLGVAFSAYNEIIVYDMLRDKTTTLPVVETTKHTPDFIITTKKEHKVNIELKTLQFNGGIYNYRDIQKQHTQVKIELEKARNNQPFNQDLMKIVTSPFKNSDQVVTRKWAIESLIKKVQNVNDRRQLDYNGNPGILMIDTTVFQFPYYIQEALPYYLYAPLDTLVSGCLWHCCYGKRGERVLEPVIYPGERNVGLGLENDGILIGNGSLLAVVFIIHTGTNPQLVGFVKSGVLPIGLEHAMGEICDFINDEYNMNLFHPIPVSPLRPPVC